MIASMISALTLFGLMHPPQVETNRINIRPWTIVVSKDQFTGNVKCLIKGRHLTIQDNVAVFDLGAHQDTSSAVYKLDRGAARSSLASIPAASLTKAVLDRTPLDNPSNGLVALPLASLTGVGHVDIRANAKTQPVGFDMAGLTIVLKTVAAQGCASAGQDVAVVQLDSQAPAHP